MATITYADKNIHMTFLFPNMKVDTVMQVKLLVF
jgi:hypothetical protein